MSSASTVQVLARPISQMTSEMVLLSQRFGGRPPKTTEVEREFKEGKMASPQVYLRVLGKHPYTGGRSWRVVLAACGLEPDGAPWGYDSWAQVGEITLQRALEIEAQHMAELEAEAAANEEERLAEQRAREQAYQAAQEKRAAVEVNCAPYEPITVPMPFDNGIAGRTEAAKTLKLINLTGYTLILSHLGRSNLRSSGTVEFFADQYKFLDDQVVGQELSRLFGDIESKRVDVFYCISHKGKQYSFPAPQPGTYYLMPRRSAELIGSTGRTMNDLIFPLQYHLREETKTIVVESVSVKLAKPAK